jgi:nucleotide-binding universal stress UspA family protein
MTSTIIVCTDGSDLAVRAASTGLSILRPVDQVMVVTVVEEIDFGLAQDASGMAGPMYRAEELERQREALLAEGEVVTAQTVAALGVENAVARVLEGSPGAEVCRLATELDATAIVVGTRGRGGFRRALLGSVSDHVVRNAPCPVVVTGGDES